MEVDLRERELGGKGDASGEAEGEPSVIITAEEEGRPSTQDHCNNRERKDGERIPRQCERRGDDEERSDEQWLFCVAVVTLTCGVEIRLGGW